MIFKFALLLMLTVCSSVSPSIAQQIDRASVVLTLPKNVAALETQTVLLSCGAFGTPTPNISWSTTASSRNLSVPSSNGVNITQRIETINTTEFVVSVLELCGVSASDKGEYQCTATNGVTGCGLASNVSSTPLTVYTTDSAFTINISSSEMKSIGSLVQLSCSVTSEVDVQQPIVFEWKNSSGTVINATSDNFTESVQNGTHTSSLLVNIMLERTSQAGIYSCELAASSNGLKITGSETYKLKIPIPNPSVTVVHAGEAQVENKELILVCQVNVSEQVNSPIMVNISWYRGNEQITPANTDMYITSSVNMMSNSMYEGWLTIKQLQVGRDNGTMYKCVSTLSSTTDVLLSSNDSDATTININVLENHPSDVALKVHGNNVTVNEKDTLILSCLSYGYPEPIIYWRRNNQALTSSVRVKLSFVTSPFDNQQNYVNSTLRILKLLPTDEGNYACIASNVKGTKMSSTNITVTSINNCAGSQCGSNGQCKDGIDTFVCNCDEGYLGVPCTEIPSPPEIMGVWLVRSPLSVQAELDQLVNLTCEVSGDPPITYKWTRDGVLLKDEILPYILIQEVKPKHRGAYVCEARNQVNSTTSQPGLLSINGIFQYEIQAFLNGSLDLLRGALLGPLVYYNQTANKDYFYNASILSVAVNYSGSTEEGMSNKRVSILVTVLDNDERINSDNFEDLLKSSLQRHPSASSFQLLNATVYDACPSQNDPIVPESSIIIKWNETMILQEVKQPCPCQTLTQNSITRHCGGSYSQGAQWMDMVTTQCNLTERSLKLCEALISLSDRSAESVAELLVNVTAAPAKLVPSEVTVAAVVIERITLAAAENESVRVNYLNSIDNIIQVDQEVIRQANASTSILQSLETFSENVDVNFTDDNRPTFTRENFAIQLQQIDISKFAGESFNVDLGTVKEAMNKSGNIDPEALLTLLNPRSNATGSLTVSNRVTERIESNASNSGRLGYGVFVSSSLFPTESVNTTVASVVLNLKLSGYMETNDVIDDLFNLTFQTIDPPMNQDVDNETCANWDTRGGFGRWTSDACVRVSKRGERPVKCKCNQPAHFGLLFDLVPSAPLIPEALAAITYVFLPLSMISLLIIIITYLAEKQLRTQPHDQIIINLSISLFGLYAFFLISGHVTSVPALCGISAGLLHYFMLVFFSWTAVESVFLFMKLVKVMGRGIHRYTLKAGLLAWIVPALVVVIVGGAGHMYYTNPFYCRADNIPFYVGTIVPIVLIFIFNWILYIAIMVSVCHRLHSAAQVTNTDLPLRKLARTAVVLSVVLGLGWAFGLVQTSAPVATSDAARVVLTVFQVLFSILVGLQGILMFGFYAIGNKKVREVWKRCFIRGKSKKMLVDLFSTSQSGSSTLKTAFFGKKTLSSGVNEYSEMPEKSVADSLYDQPTTAVTHDEKIPMTDCAAYAANPSSEKPLVSKESTAEADRDYETPDAVLEKNEKEECIANDYETPMLITDDTKAQDKDQDTAM